MEEKTGKNNQELNNKSTKRSAYCYYLKEKNDKEGMYHPTRFSRDKMKYITAEFVVECGSVSDDQLNSMRNICYRMKERDDSELIRRLEEEGFKIIAEQEA